MSTDCAIRAEALGKIYRSGSNSLIVFDRLDLHVRRGERLAIIGESGAGKSTLLHLLGGLDKPSAGKIYFGHQEVGSLTDKPLANLRNREIGFVWQNPSLLPEFTALENVMMPLLVRGEPAGKSAVISRARLKEVGLGARESHRAGELSGGEQQRVALARALAGSPRILLADEPTGNLDFRTGEMIIGLLNELHQSHQLTSIFVTHNLSFANRCDRILELRKGALHPPSPMEMGSVGVLQDATRLDGVTYV
ncbi:MAG TPA: ABC transporter ATP-binding protein [Bryobacteraceae bacterium]|nr:ABC transporter ATP-binding protein [Bryobacteraceae bacterium]